MRSSFATRRINCCWRQKSSRDIDKAKPEVLIHVQVLTASMDRLRDLGILPGQTRLGGISAALRAES